MFAPKVTLCDDSDAVTDLSEPILSRATLGQRLVFLSLQRVNTL